jgi:starvation-inducible DNA-binding protein
MKPNIQISESHLKKSIELLSVVLSDEMTLYVKTRKFHWNVTGESFMELHKLFQSQYTELEEIIDEVAERINKLGGKAIGTMGEFIKLTHIKENPTDNPIQKEMLAVLLADHETVIAGLRQDIDTCADDNHDAGTADLLTAILQKHETNAWILRRYLS